MLYIFYYFQVASINIPLFFLSFLKKKKGMLLNNYLQIKEDISIIVHIICEFQY